MSKFRNFRIIIQYLSMALIFFIFSNTFTFAEDDDVLIFNNDYYVNFLPKNQIHLYESSINAFGEDKDGMSINDRDTLELLSSNQNNQDEIESTSSKNSSNPQSKGVSLSSAHKYLGYATAIFAGVTAVTSSSKDFHRLAGYTTAGLSLITTGIGFYEYGEYIDLDEGFTGYNMHMILETAATIGFLASAALQGDNSTHAVIGGVSTALMIIPIFVVHW